MSHVAIMKKELSAQKKKATEAISMQKKLSEQVAKLLNRGCHSAHSSTSSTAESSVHLIASDNENNKPSTDNKDEQSPRQRIVSEDSPLDKLDTGKPKKTQSSLRITTNNPPSPINLANVAAEMDRMDQILAEHQEKSELFPIEGVDSVFHMDSNNDVSQIIVNAIINQESQKSLDISSEHEEQKPIDKSDLLELLEAPDAADTSDDFDIVSTCSDPKLKDEDCLNEDNVADESEISNEVSDQTPIPLTLVSSNDYEDEILEEVNNLPPTEISDLKAESENLNPAASEDAEEKSQKSWFDDDVVVSRDNSAGSPAPKKIFPYTASPKINYPTRSVSSRNYNEEFPEDITPTIRKQSIERSIRNDSAGISMSSKKASQSMSSIDAFEASFNINFPDSFSPREASIAEENEAEQDGIVTKKVINDDIYNPFAVSPVREKDDKFAVSISDDPRHRDFVKDSSLPLLSHRQISENGDSDDEYDRLPLLSPKNKSMSNSDYLSSIRKNDGTKDVNGFGNGIRDRAAAAYQRSSNRKGKFFDPPGRDRTSQRLLPKKVIAGVSINEKTKLTVDTSSKLKDPPALIEAAVVDNVSPRKDQQSPSNGHVLSRFYSYGTRQQQVANDDTASRQTVNSLESTASNPSSFTSSSTKGFNQEPFENRRITAPYVRQSAQGSSSAPIRNFGSEKKPSLESSSELNITLKSEPSKSLPANPALVDSGYSTKDNVITPVSTRNRFFQNTPPEKKNAVVSEQPSRPEKQGFDSVRAKYDRAVGALSGVITASTNNRDPSAPIISPSSQSLRDRIPKPITVDPINGSLLRSENTLADKGENDRHRTQSTGVDAIASTPNKLGSAMNSVGSIVSSVDARPAEDEGDIPLVSNLSPPKEQPDESTFNYGPVRKNGVRHENVEDASKAAKLPIDRFEQGDSAVDKYLYLKNRELKSLSAVPVSSTNGHLEPSFTATTKSVWEDDDKDDIVEITRYTAANSYDYSAASRFTLNAAGQRTVRNVSIGQTNKPYRRHDSFGQQQLLTEIKTDERRQGGDSL